ncbi:MAG: hypothetical protein GF368_00335 [Candidatus Aenigmarchaeota archaeon]|nr:hypothetical protein [Candidatus Aenigmarchaeota archaeon]
MKVDPDVLTGRRISPDYRNVFIPIHILLHGLDDGRFTEKDAAEIFSGWKFQRYGERYPTYRTGVRGTRRGIHELDALVSELNRYLDRGECPIEKLRYMNQRSRVIIGK